MAWATIAVFAFALACTPADDGEANVSSTEVPVETTPGALDGDAYMAEIVAWRAEYEEKLRAPEGWLSLVGLHWLDEGANVAGSAEDSAVPLPAERAPVIAGTFHLADDVVAFTPADGVEITTEGEPIGGRTELVTDVEGIPTKLELGSLRFYVIVRDGRYGVRVKDAASPAIAAFEGIDAYPPDPVWRVPARFTPYDPPKPIAVPTVLGTDSEMASPGTIEMTIDEQTVSMDVIDAGEEEIWLIFGDDTNRRETYGGGRFLYAPAPGDDGTLIVDFNRAYNPPCAYTPYATCPLPPPQNRLPVAIPAGEKRYGDGHH